MNDAWLLQGLMPALGGVVFLGLASRPPWPTGKDATGSRRGARLLRAAFALIGLLWLLGAALYVLGQLTRGR